MDEWYSLEDSVPDDHDGLVHWSGKIVVEVNEACGRRLESAHPVSRGSVGGEVQATSRTVLSVHLQATTITYVIEVKINLENGAGVTKTK